MAPKGALRAKGNVLERHSTDCSAYVKTHRREKETAFHPGLNARSYFASLKELDREMSPR